MATSLAFAMNGTLTIKSLETIPTVISDKPMKCTTENSTSTRTYPDGSVEVTKTEKTTCDTPKELAEFIIARG